MASCWKCPKMAITCLNMDGNVFKLVPKLFLTILDAFIAFPNLVCKIHICKIRTWPLRRHTAPKFSVRISVINMNNLGKFHKHCFYFTYFIAILLFHILLRKYRDFSTLVSKGPNFKPFINIFFEKKFFRRFPN